MTLAPNFDFSQSNLQDYVDCPYRFYLRYIMHTKWPALMVDDAFEFEQRGQAGARFHRLIQQYLLGVPEERVNELAQSDPDAEIKLWWHNFLEFAAPLLVGQKFVEISLNTALAGHRLVAKYDLILDAGNNHWIIFDWKTSQKKPRSEWMVQRIQTRLYRFVLVEAIASLSPGVKINAEQVTMNYWFANHPQTPLSLPYTEEDFRKDHTYFNDLIAEIKNKAPKDFFRTSDLKQCRYCVYRSHCDRGVQAGDLETFEDFGLQPENFELDVSFEDIAEIKF